MKNLAPYNETADIPTKGNVDSVATGGVVLPQKDPVRVISLLNVNISAPGVRIDSIPLINGDRVGLVRQTNGAENGIWIWNGSAVPMARAADMDANGKVVNGLRFSATDGFDMKGKEAVLANTVAGGVVLNTTILDFNLSDLTRKVYLSADAINNSATANSLQPIGNLTASLSLEINYRFKIYSVYSAAATSTGSRWTISFNTNPSRLIYRSEYSLTLTSRTINEALTAADLPASSNLTSAATVGNIALIEGIIRFSSGIPTLSGRFASEVAGSAITATAGVSYIEVEPLIS